MKMRDEYTCPLELTHDMTKGKWKPLILWHLGKQQAVQPAELERSIQGITQKMLLEQLAKLFSVGMVTKQVCDGFPLRVTYSITARGRKMLEAISIVQEIGIGLMKENGMDETLRAGGFLV